MGLHDRERCRMPFRGRFPIHLPVVFAALIALNVASHAAIRTVDGKVTRVDDGDLVTIVARSGETLQVRLYGIDAPEIRRDTEPGQPCGETAKQVLTGMILGKTVTLEIWDFDPSRRTLGIVYLDGRNINKEMLLMGMAWASPLHISTPHTHEFLKAEQRAKETKRGLWKDDHPVPPWKFRAERRNK
jgi:micrococcal nuclease